MRSSYQTSIFRITGHDLVVSKTYLIISSHIRGQSDVIATGNEPNALYILPLIFNLLIAVYYMVVNEYKVTNKTNKG